MTDKLITTLVCIAVCAAWLITLTGKLVHASDIEPPSSAAETVFTNGRIYTMDAATPWVEAVAISDGKYLFKGTSSQAQKFVGSSTKVHDLNGKMMMPGINDGHSHPWQGGIKLLYNCNFGFSATPDDIAARLRECIAANPDNMWVVGGQWTSDFFRNHKIASPRGFLDAISTDHVIFLHDDATHNAWVNSRALELAGIDASTPDPEGGTFVRDAEGRPNGLLYEEARAPIWRLKPEWSAAQYRAAIAQALNEANQYGLTGVNEARAETKVLEIYNSLDLAGELTAYVAANQQTPREYRESPLDIGTMVAARKQYESRHLRTGFVKFFLDGVPTASRTALMLEEYKVDAAHAKPTRGMLMIDPDTLREDLVALDAAGFTVKMHAAGDGSVRVALDAIQAVRKSNGASGLRHQLAHAGFIAPADLQRLSQLDVTADLSPYIWYPSPIIDSIIGALGERGKSYFPVRDLVDSGAGILMGSDWPSAAASISPWPGIEALVTRRNPDSDDAASLWPRQAITLARALYIATMGGARSMRLDQLTGSIEVGKSADFVVLDRNLFDIPATSISETKVEQTWFEGRLVYQSAKAGQ